MKYYPLNKKFSMISKTLFGLENILADELLMLGASNVQASNRSVMFEGELEILYKANIYCRTAGRILVVLNQFKSFNKKQLYENISKIDWKSFINSDSTFCIDTILYKSLGFDNSMYLAQVAKDAIVDQIRDKNGRRPSIDISNPDLRINLHMNQNNVTLSLDSSGESLHKRGYRKETGDAPLNEILAAGIILLSEWDQKSNLIDGMCGSGTIPIEAALIASKTAPGLLRNKYAFMNWKTYDKQLYDPLIKQAKADTNSELNFTIQASDKSRNVLSKAISNAKNAGVDNLITFECLPFEEIKPKAQNGTVIINPPYGERLAIDKLNNFYKMIGDRLKQSFNGHEAFVLTGNLEASKNIGLKSSQRIKLYNGQIESRLLKFDIYSGSRKKTKKNDSK